jgi:anti-sigma-K factor RskA
MIARRSFLHALLAGLTLAAPGLAHADPRTRAHRRVRRKVRRRVRRRIRRRAIWRATRGWRLLTVPVAMAVGWELALDDRVVVVHEVRTVEKIGDAGKPVNVEVVVVDGASGKREEIVIERADNAENGKDLDGTVLAADDTRSPSVEREEEVEEEVED